MKKIKILVVCGLMFGAMGCFKDLDTIPIDPETKTSEIVYQDPNSYRQVLAKLYAGYAVSGQQGPAGQADIAGIDEGFGQYLRGYWYHQELPTEEAVIGWNDQTIKDFHGLAWTSLDGFIYAFYSRIFYQISVANEFLRETADAKLDARGVDAALRAEIKNYRAEARFLRALSYWHALDLFRRPPFATENDLIGTFVPKQIEADPLFDYIESELLAIENDLVAPRQNEYARADRGAAWMLLAKLYLNAEVYDKGKKYEQCLTYCEKVLNAGYELEPVYQHLFLADNHKSKEIIFPIAFDGVHTRTWGGMTFIIRAGIGGSMKAPESGVVSGWGGTRATRQLIEKFPADLTGIIVDFNAGKTAQYSKLYVPGTHQEVDFDATETSNSLASPVLPSNKIFEGYKYFPDDNTQIRFTQISSNTAPYFGDNGADGTLETNGANITIAEKGLYFIKVNINTKTYTIEKRSFSIVGTATGGAEIPMTYDPATGLLSTEKTNMQVGSFAIKSNGATPLTYGDNDADAVMETNGAEIAVAKSGGHQVFLDVDKPDYTYQLRLTSFDRRGMFYTDGQNLDIEKLELFTDGVAVNKFRNVTSDGKPGKDADFPDTDFPMFRLADAYLMAAEAILRDAGGSDKNKAAEYFNKVRERAYTGTAGNIAPDDLTLELLLDERARELYWECHRRTDLVRFGKLTDASYLWAWKGGVKEGKGVEPFRNYYPIPAADLGANPGLKQNQGY